MNEPGPITSDERELTRPVFISYATADRKEALSLCKALERRGTNCWISTRDVAPGDNYQEAIVRSLRSSRAMVLVFSEAANNSDEIKKELSLASRYHVPVMAFRIEDVEPSDAFAYELSTRQWIDAFESWDKSIDSLVGRLEQVGGAHDHDEAAVAAASRPARSRPILYRRRTVAVACLLTLIVISGTAAWLFLRPRAAVAHPMQVRLAGFERLSPDLPVSLPDSIDGEIVSAFSDDGVIGVSTASAPPPGTAPAYALGGTVRRDGDKLRVIASLTDERSGASLWSNSFSYDAKDVSRVPRWIAVAAGNLMRCGLFGASTYPKVLPDPVLSDYLQFCHNDAKIKFDPEKALEFAQRVVAAAPDFSWGWSGVEQASIDAIGTAPSQDRVTQLRAQAVRAADKAIALDPANSEALAFKSYAIDEGNLIAREKLLQRALAARPLACGCEHHVYGKMLEEVGRRAAAIAELQRSTDVMPLNKNTQYALGMDLIAEGRPEQAKKHLDAYVDLSTSPAAPTYVAANAAFITFDQGATEKFIRDPVLGVPDIEQKAYLAALAALRSGDTQAKAAAAAQLVALPADMRDDVSASLLSLLGATREALDQVEEAARADKLFARSWLFLPNMAAALADPSFPARAQRLGLMPYWKASHTKPDVCSAKDPPPFCRMI